MVNSMTPNPTSPTPKVIGFTHRQKCDLIGAYSLNCSMAQFDELAVILQQAAIATREEKEETNGAD